MYPTRTKNKERESETQDIRYYLSPCFKTQLDFALCVKTKQTKKTLGPVLYPNLTHAHTDTLKHAHTCMHIHTHAHVH